MPFGAEFIFIKRYSMADKNLPSSENSKSKLKVVGSKQKREKMSFKKIMTIIIIVVLAFLMGFSIYALYPYLMDKQNKANAWGSYDGESILIEQNNVFYNTLINDSNFQTAYLNGDYNTLLQSYYNAYQSQVVFTALSKEAEKAGITAPQELVNDLILRAGIYNGSDGKFSQEVYGSATEAEKNQVNTYYTNYYPFNVVQSDLLSTIVTPAEAEFVASLSMHTRSFEYFIINYNSYPDDLAAAYGLEHADLFRHMEISILTSTSADIINTAYEALNAGTAWEDVVSSYSSDGYASEGGKVGDVRVFSLLTNLADDADIEKITSLEVGKYSEPIASPSGYSIYRADTAITDADFTDAEQLPHIKYYLSQYDSEELLPYIETAVGLATAQAQTDFEGAAKAVNSDIYTVTDAENNIGGSMYFGGLSSFDSIGFLASVAEDEAIAKELFTSEAGYVTGALAVTEATDISYVVARITDIKDDNEDNTAVTTLLYGYYAPYQPRDDRFYNVLNSDKHTDNFYTQFFTTLFSTSSSST